jgi:hypothetical protein
LDGATIRLLQAADGLADRVIGTGQRRANQYESHNNLSKHGTILRLMIASASADLPRNRTLDSLKVRYTTQGKRTGESAVGALMLRLDLQLDVLRD